MQRPCANEQMQIDDELLVIRCQLGERQAFDALIARWAVPIADYARRVSENGDAAAELTQDIWLRAFRGIGRLRDARRFRAWLFGIAHRAFADTLRRRYATLPASGSDLEQVADEGIVEDHDDLDRMERGMERLPPVEREILTLFYLQELSIDETASVLSIAPGTVKSRLHRARRMLRHELEKEGELP